MKAHFLSLFCLAACGEAQMTSLEERLPEECSATSDEPVMLVEAVGDPPYSLPFEGIFTACERPVSVAGVEVTMRVSEDSTPPSIVEFTVAVEKIDEEIGTAVHSIYQIKSWTLQKAGFWETTVNAPPRFSLEARQGARIFVKQSAFLEAGEPGIAATMQPRCDCEIKTKH